MKKKDAEKPKQERNKDSEFFYFENGLMVMTEAYHLKRGYCCGNKCRHCPYNHINVGTRDQRKT